MFLSGKKNITGAGKDEIKSNGGPFFRSFFQPKLSINQPGDEYEQEADAVADKVMRMAETGADNLFFKPSVSPIQRVCAHCDEEEKKLQRKQTNQAEEKAGTNLENYVSSLSQSGNALSSDVRSYYESRMGHDFSDVKVHTDSVAAKSAQSVNALAYTSGNNIVFNNGQFAPDTDTGKRLLAHELTHVVQQKNFLQRQTVDAPADSKEINITEQLLEIPATEEAPIIEVPAVDVNSEVPAETAVTNEPYVEVQRKSLFIQKDGAPAPTVQRTDLVFIMGTSGGFYVAAKKFFELNHPEAEIVDFKDRSLGGIFDILRARISNTTPAGNIYIVSHANQDGTLSFPLTSKDKDKTTTFGELKVALKDHAEMFKLNGGIDDKTSIHIKGCNIGRNTDMLNVLDEAFGGKDKVDAPTHKQGYEFHSEKVKGKPSTVVSTQSFHSLIMEYPGGVEKDKDTLVSDFMKKYSQLGYKDYEWKMMVLGAKAYNASVDKEGKEKKAVIDSNAKDKKKAVDKGDKDAIKAIDADTKTAKAEVDAWIKDMKASKVAAKSPGASKKVDKKFTATLYDGVDPSISPAKALPFAGALLGNSIPKGFSVTKCNSITPNGSEPLSFDFEFQIENKKTGESNTMTATTPKIPKTDEDANTIADAALEEAIGKKPESEVARRDMYAWRTDTKKGKNTLKVTSSLEMTQYTVDVDLKEESGDKIDPAKKEGDDFYYGSSDFE